VGSAIYSLDGGFIGLVSESGGAVTVVPADTLRALVAAMPTLPSARGEIAIEVQPLTADLARASGAQNGVMVSYVSPRISSSTGLASGDVIQSVDSTTVVTVADFQQLAQTRTPGASVTLAVIRRGQALKVTVTATEAGAAPPGSTEDAGIVLRGIPRVGVEIVDVQPGGIAARAGLRRGDLIVALNGEPAPGSAELQAAIRGATADRPLLLTVRRNGDHVVVAVEKP
jgi:S1-C subfamily serine protease